MDCRHCQNILQVYFDGELEALPQAAEAHLHSCATCRRLREDLQQMRELARSTAPAELSAAGLEQITMRVRQHIRAEKTAPGRTRAILGWLPQLHWRRVLAAAVASVMLLIAASQVWQAQAPAGRELHAERELEILLEEHTLEMDSGIFHNGGFTTTMVSMTSNR